MHAYTREHFLFQSIMSLQRSTGSLLSCGRRRPRLGHSPPPLLMSLSAAVDTKSQRSPREQNLSALIWFPNTCASHGFATASEFMRARAESRGGEGGRGRINNQQRWRLWVHTWLSIFHNGETTDLTKSRSCTFQSTWQAVNVVWLMPYLREGFIVRAGEVVLVEVLGVKDDGMVRSTRRQGQRLLLLLVFPLLPRNFHLLRLEGDGR